MNAGGVNHAFAYDANGNTTTDGLNALNLDYNFLNLTKQVRQGNTVKANYVWTAEGGKRSAVNGIGNGGYEYLGSLVYQRNGNALTLESAGFSGGLITPSETQYYLADHLGSTRVVVNGSGTELARYDYDPFGQATTPTGLLSSNRYLFQGKESQNAFGIPYNDHGWRMYDPKRGGWGSQDALYQYASPYTFCGNNPLRFFDPTGLWSEVKGGYSTDNPEEIKAFQRYLSVFGVDMPITQISGYVEYCMGYEDYAELAFGGGGGIIALPPISVIMKKDASGKLQWTNWNEVYEALNPFRFIESPGSDPFAKSMGTIGIIGGIMEHSNYVVVLEKAKVYAPVGSLGKGLGAMGTGISIGRDLIGYYNYRTGTEGSRQVSGNQFVMNSVLNMGAYSNAYFGIPYGLTELLYPGGFNQAMIDRAGLEGERRSTMGRWYLPLSPKSYF